VATVAAVVNVSTVPGRSGTGVILGDIDLLLDKVDFCEDGDLDSRGGVQGSFGEGGGGDNGDLGLGDLGGGDRGDRGDLGSLFGGGGDLGDRGVRGERDERGDLGPRFCLLKPTGDGEVVGLIGGEGGLKGNGDLEYLLFILGEIGERDRDLDIDLGLRNLKFGRNGYRRLLNAAFPKSLPFRLKFLRVMLGLLDRLEQLSAVLPRYEELPKRSRRIGLNE